MAGLSARQRAAVYLAYREDLPPAKQLSIDGDDECLRATIEMDDSSSASELAGALDGEASGSTVDLATCG